VTNASFNLSGIPFPVLQVSNRLWDYAVITNFNESQGLKLVAQYRAETGPTDLAYFSAKGPALSGIIKPDVVAPGVSILSANSIRGSWPNHDLDPLDLQLMDGTSMSTPNAAGTAALVVDYIRQFFGINPSSFLVKAVLISAADPIRQLSPDIEFGFGQVNLANLPLESEFQLFVRDHVSVSDESHIYTKVTVRNASKDLRIVVTFLDIGIAAEVPFPLVFEFHLIVVSPSNVTYRGNQYDHGDDEHFSTIQRVFVPKDRIELGDYEVHLIVHLSDAFEIHKHEFAIAVSGSLAHADLVFNTTKSCVGSCGTGTCSASGICSCSPGPNVGEQCQSAVSVFRGDTPETTILIPPLGNAYLAFVRNGGGELTVYIDRRRALMIHAFVVEGYPPAMPHDYGEVVYANHTWNMTTTEDVGILLRNDAPFVGNFTVWAVFQPDPTSSPESHPKSKVDKKVAIIAGSVSAAVVVTVIVAVVIVIVRTKQNRAAYGEIVDRSVVHPAS
jgi:hypothetical protein